MAVIDFIIAPFLISFGILLHAFKLVYKYAESIKCPVFVTCWGFIKFVFKMLLAAESYTDEEHDEEAIKRGDDYVNKLLEDMFENKDDEYDPYFMENSVVGFSKKVVFVNITGEAKFHDGYITGLSSLHRSEHCSLYEEGDRLRVKAVLGAGVLNFQYSGSAKFMNFGPTITVNGILSYIEVFMEFTVDSKTGRNGKLEKFIIDDMRGMKVWVTGLGPINWAINPIVSGVTKIFKRFVRNFFENKVKVHLDKKIPGFDFPVEGGESTQDPVITTTETTNPNEESEDPVITTTETTNPTEESEETSTEPNLTEAETNPTEEPEEKPSTEAEETTTPPELETIASEESEDSKPSDPEANVLEESSK